MQVGSSPCGTGGSSRIAETPVPPNGRRRHSLAQQRRSRVPRACGSRSRDGLRLRRNDHRCGGSGDRAQQLRSALTMLGVFIGVAALIAMVAVGQGANEAVRKQIESLGTNFLVVVPGATMTNGVRAGFGSASTLTVADAQAIRREAQAISLVAYLSRRSEPGRIWQPNWTTMFKAYRPITRLSPIGASKLRAWHQHGRRAQSRARRCHRPNRLSSALRARRESSRRHVESQGRADARRRRPGRQGAEQLRPGPGRPRHDPIHDRRAKGARRRLAEPGPEQSERGHPPPPNPLTCSLA